MINSHNKTFALIAAAFPLLFRYSMLAAFVLCAGIATYFVEEILFPEKSSFPRDSVEYRIDSDLIQMREDPKHAFFRRLKKVYLSDHRTEKTNINWSRIFSNHFVEVSDSNQSMQIDLFDAASEKNSKEEPLLIVQFSLVDDVSKNKIWELSRTYAIPK